MILTEPAKESRKRPWVGMSDLEDPTAALCPKCRKGCRAAGTKDMGNGLRMQTRKCKRCGELVYTFYRVESNGLDGGDLQES